MSCSTRFYRAGMTWKSIPAMGQKRRLVTSGARIHFSQELTILEPAEDSSLRLYRREDHSSPLPFWLGEGPGLENKKMNTVFAQYSALTLSLYQREKGN